MNGAALAATFVCVSAVASLVHAEARHDVRGRLMWKPLASAAFCLVPVLTGALDGGGAVAGWIMAGLVLGAAGDLFLMFSSQRAFLAGLVAFLCGHVAYVVAFTRVVPAGRWLDGTTMTIVAIAAVAAAVIVLRWLWTRLGSLRGPVIAYVAVISAMAIGAVAVLVHDNGLPVDARRLLAAGALAFYASDLAVARERFVVRDAWNRIIGLPVYYAGQLLIAWSISVR